MTSWIPGKIVWRELATTDAKKAAAFYSELCGWKITESDMGGGMIYRLLNVGSKQIGGMYEMRPEQKGMPSTWTGYVSVDDVDAAAKKAKDAGGTVLMEPTDIPNVGRFATIKDKEGAITNAFKSSHGDEPAAVPEGGEFCWDSLGTSNVKSATDFYTKVYAWTVKEFAPGMPYFAAGDLQIASFMEEPGAHPHWLTYVAVAKLGESRDRAEKLGAKILMPEIPVPGIGKFAVIADPTGAMIALFEPGPRS
ncbi:MAG TPA: VOC family protein [Polyangiaceae bacterium]